MITLYNPKLTNNIITIKEKKILNFIAHIKCAIVTCEKWDAEIGSESD